MRAPTDSFQQLPQMDGIVVLDKPEGPSSAQCLTALKRQGQRKIGHAGTLDPMASGVLPILLGQATKLSGYLLMNGRKIYSGVIRLGIETDTWDMAGTTVAEQSPQAITAQAAARAVEEWTSITEQQVPAYSAAKHNGQPLYRLARAGRETPLKIKKTQIFEAGMLSFSMPYVGFRVVCGSGAYIRSLAHSLGKRLGCGAALASLRREYSQPFGLEQAVGLDELRSGFQPSHVLPLAAALPAWPRLLVSADEARDIRNGRAIKAGQCQAERAFLCHAGMPLAVARSGFAEDGSPVWLIERGLWN